jgi:putative ABC transport system permease protein
VALRKIGRDLWLTRGRTALLIASIAVSVASLGAILSAYAILSREMPISYLSSRPASATLVLERGADGALVAAVRQRPGIAEAEARGYVRARTEIEPGTWLPLILFVVPDFEAMRIETVTLDEGAWPPPTGTMLLERGSLAVLETQAGRTMSVQTPDGQPRPVPVVGVVQDLGAAPAWQEQSGYAYITPETLAWLGESAGLEQLKITVTDRPLERAAIERTSRDLSGWLGQQGWAVEEIRIPPPGQHPHQRLMNGLAFVLLLFSLLALGLSAVVVAALVSGMLARHVRQIGTMKAIGAGAGQIACMYATMIVVIGAAAVALSIPAGLAAGRQLAGAFADLSNVALASLAIPWWVYLVDGLAGLLVPLLAASVPVVGASRVTVREALGEPGVSYRPARGTRWIGAVRISRLLGPVLTMAVRNAFRRRARLLFSLALLALGGALFMTGLNVAAASERQLAIGEAARGYDLDLVLSRPQPTESLLQLVGSVPGVAYVEPSGFAQPTLVQTGDVPVGETYKDGGHGSLVLRAVPPATQVVRVPLVEGRWLQPGDTDALVVVRGSLGRTTRVGDSVSLAVDGRTTRWQVVGLVDQPMAMTSAYVSDVGFAEAMGQVGLTQGVRVATASHDAAGRATVGRAVEGALGAAGIGISDELDAERINLALRNHLAIIQGALQFLGLTMGAVGALTLAAALSTSVVERTRELGVMQTLGATPARLIGIVVAEGTFIGCLSWPVAVALGVALSALLGALVGALLFAEPLPLAVSPAAVLGWLAIVLIGSAAASAYPARAASRLTIRDALAYV